MTVPPLVRPAPPAADPAVRAEVPPTPLAALCGSDRVAAPLAPALAAIARLDRLRRPCGPVVGYGDSAAFLLEPGAADLVPHLLCRLGWGPEIGLPLVPAGADRPPAGECPAAAPAGRVPRPRDAEDLPPRPDRPSRGQAVWLRRDGGRPAPDLRSTALPGLLDALADACARELLGLPPAR